MRSFLFPVLRAATMVAVVALVFQRAFPTADLLAATGLAVLLGAVVGLLAAARRAPGVVTFVAMVVALAGGAVVLERGPLHLDTIPNAFVVFLTVGLPARGLHELAIVPFAVLLPAMSLSVWASRRDRTLGTLGGPVLAFVVGGLLVDPVGSAWWVPLAVGLGAGLILVADARNDLSSIPPLVGTATEARRRVVWWQPIVQVVPAVGVVLVVAALLPHPATFDVRRFVSTDAERLADPNPLAVASRWHALDPKTADDIANVAWTGPRPGRLRLSVLDAYTDIGWRQSAEFAITGDTLAPDPVYIDGRAPATSKVTVRRLVDHAEFRAVPTAGAPAWVADPAPVRYAADSGMLLLDRSARSITYRTRPAATRGGDHLTVSVFPPLLAVCPASPDLARVASQLVAGTNKPGERLDRIETYLKLRRIYDPAAPGGQTLRSIEQFVDQDYARGNLEVFVSAYALLARCAGVPVRVVVGLPAPVDTGTRFSQRDVTAWVETPLETAGWVARDPLPTPDEQQQQAQSAQQPNVPPPTTAKPTAAAVPPRAVAPLTPSQPGPSAVTVLATVAAAVALVGLFLWLVVVPSLIARRRRRLADPTAAVHAAWEHVTDALLDREIGLAAHHTPTEVVRLSAGQLPISVPRLVEGLAPLVDHARYSGAPSGDEDAGLAWAYAAAITERLPRPVAIRVSPLRHPARGWRRFRPLVRVATRPGPWTAVLPDSAVVSNTETPYDIPNVTVSGRIGEGSTGTVFRGVHAALGEQVAVKVFRYGPGDAGFDRRRFDWEVEIAQRVSGYPHLPVVHGAGVTPISGRPYLVSSLYEAGTLLDRVRRGGPMTASEAVAIGSDLAIALDTLHTLGVVHADVKPENVFSDAGGWVLGDLGSAWLRASRGPAASLTPPYAAPEVWRGAPPTAVSDLYSLALTMLFAATGQVPIAGNPPNADDIVASFSDHPVLLRALEPDPRRRPRTVAEFARQLRPDLAPVPSGTLSGLNLPTPTVNFSGK